MNIRKKFICRTGHKISLNFRGRRMKQVYKTCGVVLHQLLGEQRTGRRTNVKGVVISYCLKSSGHPDTDRAAEEPAHQTGLSSSSTHHSFEDKDVKIFDREVERFKRV